MEYGTPEQKARFLPKMASSEEVWAQGWSEPNAGSDMANIQATAIKDGDHFVINGQKTWASRGAYADWLFGMFRTDPDSQRHRGLTFILVPLDLPGVTVRPIEQLDGLPGFAEVFLDDVRVPASAVGVRLPADGPAWDPALADVINSLGERAEVIGTILTVVDDVAEQTSLLSLNASILAAQAGEEGKAFADLASEIKSLAERTGASTNRIAELIDSF